MPSLEPFVDWIERHDTTVELLKWLLLLLAAWALGVFRFLRNYTRRPRLRISKLASYCFTEVFDECDGKRNVMRAAFLLDISITNRSPFPIVIEGFAMRYRRILPLRNWTPWFSRTALPSRVRQQMGSGVKFVGNWFTRFSDDLDHLTVDRRIESNDMGSGYALFVSYTYGNWNPRVESDMVQIRVKASLTNGSVLKAKEVIRVLTDKEFFEGLAPGMLEQIRHGTAWNVPAP